MAKPKKCNFLIQDGQTVVFIGDSITDTDRRASHPPYGWGYARMSIDLVTAKYPERRIAFHNKGIGGNTTVDLRDRWYDDCVRLKPDWVSLLVGINDLCRYFQPGHEGHVPPEQFRENYEAILTRTKNETRARLILMEPFYISNETDQTTHHGQVLKRIVEYTQIVREMAARFEAIHVPLHEVFGRQIAVRAADAFCPEPVHPNMTGHRVIAQAWLAAVGW